VVINATLCYLKTDDKTLMLFRNKKPNDIHQGKWNGLGGKCESGETPEECVVREVKEECGLEIAQPDLKGILTFPGFDGENDWYVYVFTAEDFSGQMIPSPEGSLRWIPNSELLEIPLWEGDRIFLPWLNDSRLFSGKFVYNDSKLIHHSVVFYDMD